MSADFRSLTTVAYGSGHINTTIAAPAGIADGDVLILVHLIAGATSLVPVPTMPAGFTLLAGFPSISSAVGFEVDTRIAYKIAASEDGDYVVSHTAASSEATLFAVSGGMAATPACTINAGIGMISTALGLTTGADNSLVAFIAHNWELYGSALPPAGPPTFTERLDSANQLTYLATAVQETAGAVADQTQANLNSAGGDPWAAFLLEVISSASPPPPAPNGSLKISSGVF